MNCAPQFIYLQQTLPMKIPLKYFKQSDRPCNTFFFNDKCPKLNLEKLQRLVNQGGLGVPNLLFHHCAFSFRHMMHWVLPPDRPCLPCLIHTDAFMAHLWRQVFAKIWAHQPEIFFYCAQVSFFYWIFLWQSWVLTGLMARIPVLFPILLVSLGGQKVSWTGIFSKILCI